MTGSLLELRDVHLAFQGRPVLSNISLNLQAGQIVTLIGPNAAGKTTLVRVVLGLLKPDKGTRRVLKGLCIGYMPQKLHIEPGMPLTVSRFLALAGACRSRAQEALACVGVAHLNARPVRLLSGGEIQRVLLARALLRKPQLLVLDEPVQGVDITGQRELYRLIESLCRKTGCAILMISHDLHLVMAATDQVICLNRYICCHGHPAHVSEHPAYHSLFGEGLAVYNHHHPDSFRSAPGASASLTDSAHD
ncbi:MAG: ATP-binding cassette domain-containing protein [Kistimonas sp.]|nr:ATP-binding cassette domain-containing protein [Kistimonas sp.]